VDEGEQHGAGRPQGAGLGRSGDAHEDRAQDQQDQDQRRHHHQGHLAQQLGRGDVALLRRQGRGGLRTEDRHPGDDEDGDDFEGVAQGGIVHSGLVTQVEHTRAGPLALSFDGMPSHPRQIQGAPR